jgi:hypothetical protein
MTGVFTAAQIGAALGVTRQAMAKRLKNVRSAQIVVGGNVTHAWGVESLPDELQSELQSQAIQRGFRNVATLLRNGCEQWKSDLPLNQISEDCISGALKLRSALAEMLQRRNERGITGERLNEIGCDGYRREFGHSVSGRYIRELFKRTLKRAGSSEDFARVELYLPDRLKRKTPVTPASKGPIIPDLENAIATFKNPAEPSSAEIEYLLLRSLEFYQVQTDSGRHAKKVKRSIVNFLFAKYPNIAASKESLDKTFRRKLALWIETGGDVKVLRDARKDKAALRKELSDADRDKIIAHAVLKTGGRLSQAWRELSAANELSRELLESHIANPASKSYVPHTIRKSVGSEIALLDDIHHGPRQHKLNGAYISCDWSGVYSREWWCMDDVTWPLYYIVPDGKGWFTLMRGQCLLTIDARSTCVLSFAQLSERNYNSRAIRTLITRTADDHGLAKGLLLERGIWQSSKILKGNMAADLFSWGEVELGLREFMRFSHSNLPRSKPVERVIGAMQNLMEGEPGYCGRNEMTEKFERFQKLKLAVEAKKTDPREHFYTEEQWEARLHDLCRIYNADLQDGKMTGGLSPDDAFAQFQNLSDPPIRLDARCRHFLAHHRRPIKVTKNGITLRFGKQAFNYRGKETGALIGQMVIAHFNPELPEIITVTDMNRENLFSLVRSQDVPRFDAPADLLAAEMEKINAHQGYAKARYRTLKSKYALPFRANIVDAKTAEFGRAVAEQHAEIAAEQKEQRQLTTKARQLSEKFGVKIRADQLQRPEAVPALERLNELLNAEENHV